MPNANDSRSEILAALRSRSIPAALIPDSFGQGIAYADRTVHFGEVLRSVGGQCVSVADVDQLRQQTQSLEPLASARKIYSDFPDVAPSTFDLNRVNDPHQLEDVDVAIIGGHFAVAENGAVWLTLEHLKHRVLPFITQHLVLIVPADQIVDNMHQAYERLEFNGVGYGLFLSGPSKTADIEQSLVIGAHGARSLTVFLVKTGMPVS